MDLQEIEKQRLRARSTIRVRKELTSPQFIVIQDHTKQNFPKGIRFPSPSPRDDLSNNLTSLNEKPSKSSLDTYKPKKKGNELILYQGYQEV